MGEEAPSYMPPTFTEKWYQALSEEAGGKL